MLITLFIAFKPSVSSLYKHVCIHVSTLCFYPRTTCGYKKTPQNIYKFFTANKHFLGLVIIINYLEQHMHATFQYKNY